MKNFFSKNLEKTTSVSSGSKSTFSAQKPSCSKNVVQLNEPPIYDFLPENRIAGNLASLSQLVGFLSGPSIIIDNRNKIICSNETFNELSGYNYEELKNKDLNDVFCTEGNYVSRSFSHNLFEKDYCESILDLLPKTKKPFKVRVICNGIHRNAYHHILTVDKNYRFEKEFAETLSVQNTKENIRSDFRSDSPLPIEKVLLTLATIMESHCTTPQSLSSLLAKTLSELLRCTFTAAAIIRKGKVLQTSVCSHLSSFDNENFAYQLCLSTLHRGTIVRTCGDLGPLFSNGHLSEKNVLKCFLGIPVTDMEGTITGVLCVADTDPLFLDNSINLIANTAAALFSMKIDITRYQENASNYHSDSLLSQITTGLAHEVRNPITGIRSLCDALKLELKCKEKYSDYFLHIKAQTQRLSHLTKQLLVLGSSPNPERIHPYPVCEVCQEAVKTWRTSTKHDNRVKLNLPIDRNSSVVEAYLDRLIIALVYLLENASQHSSPGSEVSFDISEPDDSHITLRITDQGQGLPSHCAERIFDPFFTTEKGHYGLGLSIVKKIISEHKGTIVLRNNIYEKGCMAGIRLPLYQTGIHNGSVQEIH